MWAADMSQRQKFIVLLVLIALTACFCASAKTGKKLHKGVLLQQKETNAVDFIRLVIMRLIYGMATRFGFQDNISEALNGAFVPPGVEEDYDFGLFTRDDYDY